MSAHRGTILTPPLLGLSLLLTNTNGYAQGGPEIHSFAGLELGLGTYSFQQKLDQTIVFPVANLTAGLAYQRFNLALNASGSIRDADVSEEDYTGSAQRQDLDLTFGYQANAFLSLFIGYKSGRTDLDLLSRVPADPANDPTYARASEYYEQSGPFVGINLGQRFANAGKLDFSIAYADLDANNRFFSDTEVDGVNPGEALEFDDISGKTSGSSTGYSINLSYTLPIAGNLLYRTKLRFNRYQQDIRYEGTDFNDIREQSAMLLAGIVGVF